MPLSLNGSGGIFGLDQGLNVTGVGTFQTLNVTGLTVTSGLTDLNGDLDVAGLSTFRDDVTINYGSGIGLSITNGGDFSTADIVLNGHRNLGDGVVGEIKVFNRKNNEYNDIRVLGNGDFQFRHDGVDLVKISDIGSVGIGTDDLTSAKLHIRNDSGELARFQINNQTSSGRIVCVGGTASYAGINFGDLDDVDEGRIRYYNNANNDAYQSMLFYTNNSERLRIGSAGQIGLSGANYGTNNQVITSTGTGSAAVWSGVNAAFYGYQGTAHNVAHATWTVVRNLGGTGSPPPIDTPGWDHSTGLFTADANTAGTWYIFGSGGIDDIQTLDVVYMGIMINGTNPSVYTHSRMYSGATNSIMGGVTVAAVVTLADGDTVGVGIYHNEGTTEPTEPNRCFVGGFRLSV